MNKYFTIFIHPIFFTVESSENKNVIAAFHSKGFRYPFWASILVIMQIGMLAMFASFAIGLPVFLSVATLLAAFTLGIGFLGGYTSYFLTKDGIVQEIKPFKWMPLKLKPLSRSFGWSDIKSYKMGSDLSRSFQRYNYLYISVGKMPYQLRLSDDQSDKVALQIFSAAFENALVKQTESNLPFAMAAAHEQRPVRLLRKPDFYHTRFAHVLFCFFMIVVVVLAWAMFTTGNMKPQYLWRFAVIIVPGMGYMAYRLYGRGKQE